MLYWSQAFMLSIDVFLDTFPQTAGLAAIESMAKGKPVFSLECESLKFLGLNRIQRLIFGSQNTLIMKY